MDTGFARSTGPRAGHETFFSWALPREFGVNACHEAVEAVEAVETDLAGFWRLVLAGRESRRWCALWRSWLYIVSSAWPATVCRALWRSFSWRRRGLLADRGHIPCRVGPDFLQYQRGSWDSEVGIVPVWRGLRLAGAAGWSPRAASSSSWRDLSDGSS